MCARRALDIYVGGAARPDIEEDTTGARTRAHLVRRRRLRHVEVDDLRGEAGQAGAQRWVAQRRDSEGGGARTPAALLDAR